MSETVLSKKWKIHVAFAGGFLAFLSVSVIANMGGGQAFRDAILNALREIRPMEYAMLLLFWYSSLVYYPRDEWRSTLTTLNLGRSDR
jgi:hypothetical protein